MKLLYVTFMLLVLTVPVYAADVNTVIDVIECESSGRHNAIGDSGKSYGIAQFKRSTFNEMKRQAHMPKLQYKNPIHQMRLMVWGFDHGYGHRWTCFRKLKKKEYVDAPLQFPQQAQSSVVYIREKYE